jgi:hypothetical protein
MDQAFSALIPRIFPSHCLFPPHGDMVYTV